jgi:hypothetical protein
MASQNLVHVRCLALFHTIQRDHGRPNELDVEIPDSGVTVLGLVELMGLPTDILDGAFVNYRNSGPDAVVFPGDRVALVPVGTPASHPAFFGAFVTRG